MRGYHERASSLIVKKNSRARLIDVGVIKHYMFTLSAVFWVRMKCNEFQFVCA